MHQQTLIQHAVPLDQLALKSSLGKAIEYCAELAGYSYDKRLEEALSSHGMPVDKTQLSRWQSGAEGVKWEKFVPLMDACGNDAPVLWMLQKRGWDLSSIRKLETEYQRENRLLREENAALKRVITGAHS